MALISLSEWIDRFGELDQEAAEAATSPPADELRTLRARNSTASMRIACARRDWGAFVKATWARRKVPSLALRRG